MHKGRVVFGAMDEVVFGRPASEAIVEQMEPAGREARLPDGQRHAQPRDRRDRKHPPRAGAALRRHIRRDAAAHAARGGDRRRRTGPRRRRPISSSPSAAARSPTAPRRCSFASPTISAIVEDIDRIRAGQRRVAAAERADRAPDQRADHDRRRRVLRHCRRHQREDQGQGAVAPSAADAARGDPRSRAEPRTRRNGCGCRPASAPSIIASRASARARRILTPMPRR